MPEYVSLKDFTRERILEAHRSLHGADPDFEFDVHLNNDPQFGDFSSNIALIGANKAGTDPLVFAQELIDEMKRLDQTT